MVALSRPREVKVLASQNHIHRVPRFSASRAATTAAAPARVSGLLRLGGTGLSGLGGSTLLVGVAVEGDEEEEVAGEETAAEDGSTLTASAVGDPGEVDAPLEEEVVGGWRVSIWQSIALAARPYALQ